MEEAIVDVALDLNLLPAGHHPSGDAQQDRRIDQRDQAQLLATVPHTGQASPAQVELPLDQQQETSPTWVRNRAARIENLRQCVADGSYHVDIADLTHCILRNSTRFVETC